MQFKVNRNEFLTSLQSVAGVIERRQVIPILSNILMQIEGSSIQLTGSSAGAEVQIRSSVAINIISNQKMDEGNRSTTVAADKLLEIVRTLSDESEIDLQIEKNKVIINAPLNNSHFVLNSLPADGYSLSTVDKASLEQFLQITIEQSKLKQWVESIAFCIAKQEVRSYLQGMLFKIKDKELRLVAADGHRLAMIKNYDAHVTSQNTNIMGDNIPQSIIPRKAIMELLRLLEDKSTLPVEMTINTKTFSIKTDSYCLTSLLISDQFPDYNKIIPNADSDRAYIEVDRQQLQQSLTRVAILSNVQYRGVKLNIADDTLVISANNTDQEYAEEKMPIVSEQKIIKNLALNASYLLDILRKLSSDRIRINFIDCTEVSDKSRIFIEEEKSDKSKVCYVIMLMRLQ